MTTKGAGKALRAGGGAADRRCGACGERLAVRLACGLVTPRLCACGRAARSRMDAGERVSKTGEKAE